MAKEQILDLGEIAARVEARGELLAKLAELPSAAADWREVERLTVRQLVESGIGPVELANLLVTLAGQAGVAVEELKERPAGRARQRAGGEIPEGYVSKQALIDDLKNRYPDRIGEGAAKRLGAIAYQRKEVYPKGRRVRGCLTQAQAEFFIDYYEKTKPRKKGGAIR